MTNKNYPALRNDLSIFSREVGLSFEIAERYFRKHVLENLSRIPIIKKELLELFSDADVDWYELGFNDSYELMAEPTPEAVRAFIIEHIWNKVFPDTPPPKSLE